MSRAQIARRYDDIVAFSGLGDYIEEPVKNYSSGMYVRLGFSVAIHTDPDILLVDEVLAVGDEAFAHQCLRRIAELLGAGKTVLMVSHALALIEEMCDRVLWLERGRQRMIGEPRRVVDAYRLAVAEQESRQHLEAKERRERRLEESEELGEPATAREARTQSMVTAVGDSSSAVAGEVGAASATPSGAGGADGTVVEAGEADLAAAEAAEVEPGADAATAETTDEPEPAPERWGSREAVVRRVRMLDGEGAERYHFESGETVVFEIHADAERDLDDFVFGVGIFTPRGVDCWGTNTDLAGYEPEALSGATVVRLVCPQLRLAAGEYLVDVAIHARDGAPYDYHRRHLGFSVTAATPSAGIYRPEHRWEFDERVAWKSTPV